MIRDAATAMQNDNKTVRHFDTLIVDFGHVHTRGFNKSQTTRSSLSCINQTRNRIQHTFIHTQARTHLEFITEEVRNGKI